MANLLYSCDHPVLAAAAVGLSCGTACSPLINLFLTTYTMGRFNSMQRGLQAFGYFWLGKATVVSILALVSASVGRAIISQSQRVASFDPRLILDGCLILTGSCLLIGMFRRKRETVCSDCVNTGCRCADRPYSKMGRWPLVTIGAAYGLTPCSPLLLFLLIAAVQPPLQAIGVSLVFSVTNSISPLLVLTALAGLVSQKMQQEIPQLLRVFQINIFCLFIIMGSISLFRHL